MCLVCRRNRKPRRSFGKTRILAAIPLHGSAFAVATFFFGPTRAANRILYIFPAGGRRRFHSDLFSVVHDRRAAQREIKRCHQLRDLVVVLAIAIPIVGTHDVVVADHESRPSRCGVYGSYLLTELRGRQLVDHGEKKIHGQLQFIITFSVILVEFGNIRRPCFPDEYGIVFVRNLTQSAQDIVHLGQLGVVFFFFERISEGVLSGFLDGIISQSRIFKQSIDRIQPESGHTTLVPPAGHIEHCIFNGGITPIQIGLLGIEVMIVVLICCGIEFPCRPSKGRDPIVGRLSRPLAVPPDIPITMRRGAR